MEIIDLSPAISADTQPFVEDTGYSDPETLVEPWVRIGQDVHGWRSLFHVSRLSMSAHTGSHLDAPSHFQDGAATVSDLPLEFLAGRAIVIDAREGGMTEPRIREAHPRASQRGVTPLVLTPQDWLTAADVNGIAAWNRPLVTFAGEDDADLGYVGVRHFFSAQRWMVSNLGVKQALRVRDGDLLVVAPLPLVGVEGSPCRVLALRL